MAHNYRSLTQFRWHEVTKSTKNVLLLPLNGMLVHPKVTSPPRPPALCCWFPFIHLGVERQHGEKFLGKGNNMVTETQA